MCADIDRVAFESYSLDGMDNPDSAVSLRSWTSLPRPLLIALAILFCGAATLYAAVWMYDARSGATIVELGFNKLHNEQYDEATHSIAVGDVVEGSPAERAGLKAGDRIIGVNGKALDTSAPYDEAYSHG